ncbi:nuclease-related domain-containing protein [Actinomadura verrucosospora]|uniref:NERD domain-containing protein n=1 Tax=Actinomadura verrucosospora TaxID=46165 RepID=A0A7D3VWF0_ACTVE|nr:nuclease-related domain-containing protein [Actinomadura verrucosospora]QKG24358.1 NERD domain-containing protein [Actinomadura verrucosospora]
MDGLEAKVWRRYGRLRVYVSRGDEKVGWYDVRTGRHELTAPDLAAPFWHAVRTECHTLGEAAPATTAAAHPPDAGDEQPDTSAAQAPTTGAGQPTTTGAGQPSTTGAAQPPAAAGGGRPPAAGARPPVARGGQPRTGIDPGIDLAHNRPGAAAQARADELRNWRTRLAALFGARTDARDFAVGAKAERVIGGRLDKWARKHGWHVLHAVPVGRRGADIDHVLIGPFGVITVNTKSTRGKVWVAENGMMVGGTKVDYLRNSRHEAKRARKLLADAVGRHVPVHPVVVFVGAEDFTVRNGGPQDVAVLRDVRAFRRWLRRCGRVLTPEQVADVHTAARSPATWQG